MKDLIDAMTPEMTQQILRQAEALEAEAARLRAQLPAGAGAAGTLASARSIPIGRDELFSAVEKTRMPMILTDPNQPDDPIIFANRAFQELSGYGGEELVGHNCRFLQGPDTDPAQVAQIRQALATDQDIAIEILNYRRDGTPFANELYISPVFDHDGRLLYHFGSQLDVTGYRRDRRRLEAAERQLRAIFDSALDVAIIATDRDGRVTDWNTGAERVLGWNAAEMLGQSTERFFTPEDRAVDRVGVEMRLALEEGRAGNERWHLRRDGSRFWASGEMMPLRDGADDHIGFISVLRDQTEQHQASTALREQEMRLRLATTGARLGTFDYDVRSNELIWDDRCRELFGLPLGVPVSYEDTFLRGLHPEDQAEAGAAVARSLDPAGSGHFTAEYRTIGLRDGIERWVSATGETLFEDGRPVRLIGTVLDITDRKRADATLRARETLVRANTDRLNETLEQRVEARTRELHDAQDFTRLALISVGGVGAWSYDVASGRYFGSPAIAELYGVDPVQTELGIDRQAFLRNVHPDDLPQLKASLTDELEQAGDFELQYRIRHPDGRTRWLLSRGHTYVDAAGRPTRRLGVGIEVTRQRELEEQLRQSQKMEAVGQLTGGLAHDFNNLLTGITGSLELLSTHVMQGRLTGMDRYITAAQGAAARAAALTHRLLAFSRRQTLDPKPTDVNRLVTGMEDLIRRTIGSAITVEVVGTAGLWPTLVDPNQLENALLNLCINARDAMPDGGRLTIETANRWLDQRAAQGRDLPPGQYVSLCVSDTGTGMPPDVIAKAFDPFFTTKPLGQGTGLGLSMIYGFTRQSGGQVRIYSEPGQGAMVCLYLPRHLGEAEVADAVAELADLPRAGQGETVLVVDDEPTIRMLVTEVLGELGYASIEVADGLSGLRVLQSDARVDLLVTDVGLPGGMNGRQMVDAARVTRPDLRVLFITGYAENAVVGNGHLGQGMHVMTKPFAMEALASRIRELIDGTPDHLIRHTRLTAD